MTGHLTQTMLPMSVIFYVVLSYLNFYPFKVVSRYINPQIQVIENYLYLFNLKPIYLQNLMFKHSFHSQD